MPDEDIDLFGPPRPAGDPKEVFCHLLRDIRQCLKSIDDDARLARVYPHAIEPMKMLFEPTLDELEELRKQAVGVMVIVDKLRGDYGCPL